ncbi:MAG: hypothetical protein V3V05_03240 [Pontiella sp.]
MATKRKTKKRTTKKNQVQVPFPVLLANVLVLVAVLGLSYMWLCSRCDALGKDIKSKEGELYAAQKRLVNEQDRWSSITSPANLERAIRKYKLDMSMPREQQIVRIGSWNGAGRTAQAGLKIAHP